MVVKNKLQEPIWRGGRCPDCDWVMPLPPGVTMTWCPCGWRKK